MKGTVVINGHLNSGSFKEPADMMVEAGKRHDVKFDVKHNTELTVPIGDSDAFAEILGGTDFIVFWDKDVKVAKNLEVCGYPVINCSECIRVCDDKSLTYLTLAEYGIPTIKTVISPLTFGYPYGDWVMGLKKQMAYPMVVKDCFGSFGEQVRLVENDDQLMKESGDDVPKVFQEYIECGAEDLRLQVVGSRVVAAVKRKAANGDFRANSSHGGIMEAYEPTDEERQLALDAA
jgi:RimK family alpha-L-glutamate ligase